MITCAEDQELPNPGTAHFYGPNPIILNPCNAESTFCPRHNIVKIFGNYLNHVMLVFILKPSLSTII